MRSVQDAAFEYYKQRELAMNKGRAFPPKHLRTRRPDDKSLLIDPKSSEPRCDQIKRQIQEFTQNQYVKRTEAVSMDDFVELVRIDKEFGPLELGHQMPKSIDQIKPIEFGQKQYSKGWELLATVLNYGPNKMENFRQLVAQAEIESSSDYEMERKKVLLSFLKNKQKKPGQKGGSNFFHELMQNLQQDEAMVRAELAQMTLKDQLQSEARCIEEAKEMIQALEETIETENAQYNKIRTIFNLSKKGNMTELAQNGRVNCGWTDEEWQSIQEIIKSKSKNRNIKRLNKDANDDLTQMNIDDPIIEDCKQENQENDDLPPKLTPRLIKTARQQYRNPRDRLDQLNTEKKSSYTKSLAKHPVSSNYLKSLMKKLQSSMNAPIKIHIKDPTAKEYNEKRESIFTFCSNYCEDQLKQSVDLVQNEIQQLKEMKQCQKTQFKSKLSQSTHKVILPDSSCGLTSESQLNKKQFKEKIQQLKYERSFLLLALDSLVTKKVVPVDQIMLLKQCPSFSRFYLALTALKLIHCYKSVSDEFGFNPKGDRENIMKGLEILKEEIMNEGMIISDTVPDPTAGFEGAQISSLIDSRIRYESKISTVEGYISARNGTASTSRNQIGSSIYAPRVSTQMAQLFPRISSPRRLVGQRQKRLLPQLSGIVHQRSLNQFQ